VCAIVSSIAVERASSTSASATATSRGVSLVSGRIDELRPPRYQIELDARHPCHRTEEFAPVP
jgi:hypothetical protein